MNVRYAALLSTAAFIAFSGTALAQPLGTSFTYQGRLKQSGLPANAPVDLQFALYDAASGGTQAGSTICRDNVPVTDGLFTVSLDFGPQFTGMERYLQIGVRPAGGVGDCGSGNYTPLNARQAITGVPYAQWSNLGGGGGGDCCEPRIDVATLPGSSTALHVISEPGSFYLRGNIPGVSGKNGIVITANNVTLDLNGFALVGVTGSLNGISTPNLVTNVVIENGNVQSWGGSGIGTSINVGRIEKISAANNVQWGIVNIGTVSTQIVSCEALENGFGGIKGDFGTLVERCVSMSNGYGFYITSGTIANCVAERNDIHGIKADNFGCTVTGCTTDFNGEEGISADYDCTIALCTSHLNAGIGIKGGNNCSVTNCTASENGESGITIGVSSMVSNSTASQNDGAGIGTGNGCTIRGCTADHNGDEGIVVPSECTLTDCTAFSNGAGGIVANLRCVITNCNTNSNMNDGIWTHRSTVTNCTANDNGNTGIVVDRCSLTNCSCSYNSVNGIVASLTTVKDSVANFNTEAGIVTLGSCIIQGNVFGFNGGASPGAGIYVLSTRNRIEGNNCMNNAIGVYAPVASNVISKNTCRENTTNWSIGAGNAVAPIVQASTNAAIIEGNTYSGNLGSTDPNANFTY